MASRPTCEDAVLFCETLHVSPEDPVDAIKKRFHAFCLKHHPDKVTDGDKVAATKFFVQIDEVWQVVREEGWPSSWLRYLKARLETPETDETERETDETEPPRAKSRAEDHKPLSQRARAELARAISKRDVQLLIDAIHEAECVNLSNLDLREARQVLAEEQQALARHRLAAARGVIMLEQAIDHGRKVGLTEVDEALCAASRRLGDLRRDAAAAEVQQFLRDARGKSCAEYLEGKRNGVSLKHLGALVALATQALSPENAAAAQELLTSLEAHLDAKALLLRAQMILDAEAKQHALESALLEARRAGLSRKELRGAEKELERVQKLRLRQQRVRESWLAAEARREQETSRVEEEETRRAEEARPSTP